MCECVCVYVYVCMSVCVYVYVCVGVWVCVCVYVCDFAQEKAVEVKRTSLKINQINVIVNNKDNTRDHYTLTVYLSRNNWKKNYFQITIS